MPEQLQGPGGQLLSPQQSAEAAVDFLQGVGELAWTTGDRAAIQQEEEVIYEHLDKAADPAACKARMSPAPDGARRRRSGRYTMEELEAAEHMRAQSSVAESF